jgi:beta-galactosidase/beta-glucuronidase
VTAALHAADLPRPEFPQPQFQREDWLSLNGTWQFAFDDAAAQTDPKHVAFTRTITVPFCFESAASGIGDTSFHPVVWYRRQIAIPRPWSGRHVLLHFGAVDYRASVWVNGQLVGTHRGGNAPFQFDITPQLKGGRATVVVRAEDSPTDRYQPRGKQYWQPASRSIWYTRTSGIWQSVWLEATGESYFERVRITPSLGPLLVQSLASLFVGEVRFDALVANATPGLEIAATVKDMQAAVGEVSERRATAEVIVANPRLWSVESPNLYDVVFELRRGKVVLDRVHSYFGFRSLGVKDGRVTINGQPVYLKFVLDQGYWPTSILTPPSDEALQSDIRVTKEMGFNGARKHQKVEDPRYLYWADHMGFLVSGEMANAQRFDSEYVSAFTQEWMEVVERDYNHPSVIIWAPLNESWGTPRLIEPMQQSHLKALYELTHSIDGTRLVIDNEGWEHTASTDLLAFHDYTAHGPAFAEKYKTLPPIPENPNPNSKKVMIPGYAYNGTPFYLSEFGGIAFIPDRSKVPEAAWGYSGVEATADDALTRLRGLYEAIAGVRAITGICYTQLTDVEQEVNGLLTYDRHAKFDAARVRALNELLR